MTLPELKALIVTRRLKGQDCSALVVLCEDIHRELNRRSRIQRILGDDRAAIDRLCEDDNAMERLLGDLGLRQDRSG